MTTEIRLLFRHGPTTTVKFNGTFAQFQFRLSNRSISDASSRLKQHDLSLPYVVDFTQFSVNLSELACAYVYAEHPDEPDDPPEEKPDA